MAISGSLDEASLPDVLQLLSLGRKTGRLSLSDQSSLGHIYLESGMITHAYLVNRRDRLGDILFKSGSITREQLNEAIRLQSENPSKKLGEILVDNSAISPRELERHMQMQVEEAVYFLFTWRSGDFTFERDVQPESRDFNISVDPEALLLEGARRVDEWSVIEKKIPSFDMVFALDSERIEASSASLSEEQQRIASLLDGSRDVSSMVDKTGMAEFEVGKALYGLISAGFAHVSERGPGSRGRRSSGVGARAGHLNYASLLAYLTHDEEFADPELRRESGIHIADCPTCSKRIKEIHTRRSEGLLAIPESAPPTVEQERPEENSSDRRSETDRRKSGGSESFDPAKDRRVHGAGDRRGATRTAAASGRRPIERRSGQDRRRHGRRQGDRRSYTASDRSDRFSVERRAGRDRRMRERRSMARRSTDRVYQAAVAGSRSTAAINLKGSSPPSQPSMDVTARSTNSTRDDSRRETRSIRRPPGRTAGATSKRPKQTQENPPTPANPNSADGAIKPPRHSIRRLRESPLKGLPLLADPTEWRFQERVSESELTGQQRFSDSQTENKNDRGGQPEIENQSSLEGNSEILVPDAASTANNKSAKRSASKPSTSKGRGKKKRSKKGTSKQSTPEPENAKSKTNRDRSDSSKGKPTKQQSEAAKADEVLEWFEKEKARAEKMRAEAEKRLSEAAKAESVRAWFEIEKVRAEKRRSSQTGELSAAERATLEAEKAEAEERKAVAEKRWSDAARAKADGVLARLAAEDAEAEAAAATAAAEATEENRQLAGPTAAAPTQAETVSASKPKNAAPPPIEVTAPPPTEVATPPTKPALENSGLEENALAIVKAKAEEDKAAAEKRWSDAAKAKAKADAEKAKAEEQEAARVAQAKAAEQEAARAKAGAEQARLAAKRAKAEKTKSEVAKHKLDAERARYEAEKAKSETDKTKSEAEKARLEAERARLEAEKARIEAEQARSEIEKAKSIVAELEPDIEETAAAIPVPQEIVLESPPVVRISREVTPRFARPVRRRRVPWLGVAAGAIVLTAAGWFARPLLFPAGADQTSSETDNLELAAGTGVPAVLAPPALARDSEQTETPAVVPVPADAQETLPAGDVGEEDVDPSATDPLQATSDSGAAPILATTRTADPPSETTSAASTNQPTQVERTPPVRTQTPTPAAAPPVAEPLAPAPARPAPTSLTGVVQNAGTGEAVAGAIVAIPGTAWTSTTNAAGTYSLEGVRAGSLTVVVQLNGFLPLSETIVAVEGQNNELDLTLHSRPSASAPDEELSVGQWEITDQAGAAELLGRRIAIVGNLWIESIAKPTAGGRARIRVAHLTDEGERVILTISRSGPAVGATRRVTALRIIPPSEAYPLTTGTASIGGLLVTAKTTLPADSLRAHLSRLVLAPES